MAIKINLDENKERKFRKIAMKKFGYKRGSLKKALEEAIDLWLSIEDRESSKISNPTRELEGLLASLDDSSVELQHLGSSLLYKEQ